MNVYRITVRGRQRAAWWVQAHSLTSIAYLASNPAPGKELEQAAALKPLEEFRPLLSAGPRLLTFRSRDPDNLGPLLFTLSGNQDAYLIDNLPLWIHQLERDETVPDHLASLSWVLASQAFCGGTSAQILVSTLYKSTQYYKRQYDALRRELEELWQNLHLVELKLQGEKMEILRDEVMRQQRMSFDYRSSLLKMDITRMLLNEARDAYSSTIISLHARIDALLDEKLYLTNRISTLEKRIEWQKLKERLAVAEQRLDDSIQLKRERRACEMDFIIRRETRAEYFRRWKARIASKRWPLSVPCDNLTMAQANSDQDG